MPMSPGQLLMMRRQGPGLAPGAPSAMAPAPAAAGAAPGGAPDIGQLLAKTLASLGGGQSDFTVKVVENMKKQAAVLIAKLNQSHPEVARHMTRAYSSLDAALTAAKKTEETRNQPSAASGPLGFSGAQMGVPSTDDQSPMTPGAMG